MFAGCCAKVVVKCVCVSVCASAFVCVFVLLMCIVQGCELLWIVRFAAGSQIDKRDVRN